MQTERSLVSVVKEIPRLKIVVVPEREKHAVILIRARLGRDRHSRSAGHSLLRVKTVGRDIYRLDSFRRRHIGSVMRKPYEHIACAVDSRVVVIAVRPVDVCGKRPLWRVRHRVLKLRRRRTRHQIDRGSGNYGKQAAADS